MTEAKRPIVLITGAAGNIGRSLASALADAYAIVGLDQKGLETSLCQTSTGRWKFVTLSAVGGMAKLIATFPNFGVFVQDAVHGPDRAVVDVLVEQGGVDFGRSEIGGGCSVWR